MIKVKGPILLRMIGPTVNALSLFCFLIYKDEKTLDDVTINHEKIHYRQCLEGLVIGFWLLYFWYLFRRGYWQNPFEKEAYDNEHDLTFLKRRKFWNWLKYV